MDRYLRKVLEAFDSIALRYIILFAIGSLIVFAGLYDFGSPLGWGLKDSTRPDVDFWTCLYFSVVTFTSLGFGDLVPVGFARLLAGVEVILGLTVFGIVVAKLSSYKQSYLLNQIYARDVQSKLDLFAEEIRSRRSACKQLTKVLKKKEIQVQALGKVTEDIKTDLTRIRAYVSFESRNGYLLSGTPIGSITRLLKALSSMVPNLVEVVSVRRTRSSQKHRDSAQEVLKLAIKISKHFLDSKNGSMISEANLLKSRCEDASTKLRALSVEVEAELKHAESQRRAQFEARKQVASDNAPSPTTNQLKGQTVD